MTTRSIQRPWFNTPDLSWFKRINWQWWLMRVPMALLAVPAAYGVGAFASEHLPSEFAVIAGAAFECCYLGAIALADQQHEADDHFSTGLWWAVNIGAVVASILCNLLFVSDFKFANVVAESYVHAVPMPVLGFLYGLLMHRLSSKAAAQAIAEEQATAYKCKFCGNGFPSPASMYGHYRRCEKRSV